MRLKKLSDQGQVDVGDFVVVRVVDHTGGDDLAEVLTAGVVLEVDGRKLVIDHWYEEGREAIDKSCLDRRMIVWMLTFEQPE